MIIKFKQDMKLESERIKHRRHCKKCGHTISFYSFEPDRKLCNFCGVFNYRNDSAEFKEKLIKRTKEIAKNE